MEKVNFNLKQIAERNKSLPNTHGKSVDVFVELIQQRNGLDDHVVSPVNIKLDFCSGVAVTKAQLCFRGRLGSQALHQGVEVKTHALERKTGSVCFDQKEQCQVMSIWCLFRFSV